MVNIYTDGSCLGNPGPGGWGAIIEGLGERRMLSGADPATTNNRMEIMAAIKGLEAVPAGTQVTVHSDSQYVVNTMTKNWKRNLNADLWKHLDALVAERKVSWQWVRGHAGHPQNEEADRLAVAAMKTVAPRAAAGESAMGKEQAAPGTGGEPREGLTHLDAEGRAHMVDVSGKPETDRTAIARGAISMRPDTLTLILEGRVEKGDVFTVARLAGINAAKHTWELIPLAHQIPLGQVQVDFTPEPMTGRVVITASARTMAKTGVEMEALAAVSLAALTIYDMCKAVDRGMIISEVRLLEKRGGVHGDYTSQA
ncbi:MAG: cyclic pyranopterin monophosphate synthase MoaC [Dehalococcoidia bacterium]